MNENETLRTILQRRSVRSYEKRQIPDEHLRLILEAAQYAPHAGDEAWHFTAVQDKELLCALNEAAKEAGRASQLDWLQNLGADPKFDCLYGAPTLVLVSGDGTLPFPLDADCAAATENMLLTAQSLGIASCWIFFVTMAFESDRGNELRERLRLPEGYRPYNAAVFGYAKEPLPAAPPRRDGVVTVIR